MFVRLGSADFFRYVESLFLQVSSSFLCFWEPVLQNVDDLFERPELSAAPDVGWPDCFNSGVFVFEPSARTFGELLDLAVTKGSFDGADQGLLNQYFSSWATSDAK